jgi:hypothetical protein
LIYKTEFKNYSSWIEPLAVEVYVCHGLGYIPSLVLQPFGRIRLPPSPKNGALTPKKEAAGNTCCRLFQFFTQRQNLPVPAAVGATAAVRAATTSVGATAAVEAATTSVGATAAVEAATTARPATTTAAEGAATAAWPAASAETPAAGSASTTVKPAATVAIEAAPTTVKPAATVAIEATSTASIEAAVTPPAASAEAAPKSTPIIAASKSAEPRAGADEDAAVEILGPVVAVRGASVWVISVVAIGADWRRTNVDWATVNRSTVARSTVT